MPHKLLLADDSVTIQRVIELTFADEDVQVRAVGDGKKAIASIQADRPDIVLADVGMPERDGYEVAAFIKGNPQLAHIPVLLLTGAFEPVDETRAREVGCDGVLVKPFEPQMVINRVKDLLAGRRTAPAPMPAAAPPAPVAPKDAHASGGSLEEYFDRLDAAFASLDGAAPAASSPQASAGQATPARATSPMDDFGGWDPDLTAGSAKPAAPPPAPRVVPPPLPQAPPASAPVASAPVPPAISQPAALPSQPAPVAAVAPPPAAAPAPAPVAPAPPVPLPSLAEAFAALLSAEQARPIAPSKIGAPAAVVTDDVVEEVVRRVIARMGDSVLDAAERLVREEIDRIKRA